MGRRGPSGRKEKSVCRKHEESNQGKADSSAYQKCAVRDQKSPVPSVYILQAKVYAYGRKNREGVYIHENSSHLCPLFQRETNRTVH